MTESFVVALILHLERKMQMEMYTLDTAMIRLKEISDSLESGEYDLEMSMKLYEEGISLVAFCNKNLSNVKQKITELSQLPQEELDNE